MRVNLNDIRVITVALFFLRVDTAFAFQTRTAPLQTRGRAQMHRDQMSMALQEVTTEDIAASSVLEDESPSRESVLREFQARASRVAKSFVPATFNPHPLLTNKHLQTIGGVFLRSQPGCAYVANDGWEGLWSVMQGILEAQQSAKRSNSQECTYWDERERIETPDGDFFHVDYKYSTGKARGTVIVVHGLESNSNSTLSIDMSRAYHSRGFNIACMNLRGCSGVPNRNLGMYHAGFTDDLRHFLGVMKERNEQEQQTSEDSQGAHPLYLSGFSLGTNIVLKALGELGEGAKTLYNIHGAAVTGAPFDIERNIHFVDAPGFNRFVYAGNFLKSMKQKCVEKLELHCENDPDTKVFDFKRAMAADTIAELENGWIAPVYGFKDNIDYYRKVSCTYFLEGIAVPTYIMNAGDDPFFDPSYFPIEKGCDGGGNAPIKMSRTQYGGHLGFLFHRPENTPRNDQLDASSAKPVSSWMPTELARFIEHVDAQSLY